MDYKKLAEVNAKLKTTNIKGKEYAEVNQRILAFRELCEKGRIVTVIDKITDESVLMHAEIYDDDNALVATGYAQEFRSESPINKWAYVENCETSCIGRALGILGIGTNGAIASADEVSHKISLGKDDIEQNNKLLAEARELNIDIQQLHKWAEAKAGIGSADMIPNNILQSSINKRKEALALNANAPSSKSV